MDFTIVDYFGYNMPGRERMRLIKEAGFKGIVGLLWRNDFDADYNKFPKYAYEAGLYIENIHGPWRGLNDIWNDNLTGQNFAGNIVSIIQDSPGNTSACSLKAGGHFSEL